LDAITSITSRIGQIETQLAAVRAGANVRAGTGTATATGTAGSFASTYAQALTSVSPTSMNPSSSSTVGTGATRLNKDGVPVELVAYGNGKIPSSALHPVGNTGHKLWAPAADSLTALVADAKRAGVNIGITDSYRPYAEQVDLARRKGLYSQGGLAAKPGTSDHGWGLAVDLDLDSKAQAWMRANAGRYGFVEDTPREPWHWAYTPKA
jgi:zinc D-Ala-D-Ala carboxypeptidase